MSYQRTALLDLVDAFRELVGFSVTNAVGHVVLEDYNLDDDNIDWQLKYAEAHRAEWRNEPGYGVTEMDATITIAFLNFLKTIPEDQRTAHWDDEDEDEDAAPVSEAPKKSEDWLRRHDR